MRSTCQIGIWSSAEHRRRTNIGPQHNHGILLDQRRQKMCLPDTSACQQNLQCSRNLQDRESLKKMSALEDSKSQPYTNTACTRQTYQVRIFLRCKSCSLTTISQKACQEGSQCIQKQKMSSISCQLHNRSMCYHLLSSICLRCNQSMWIRKSLQLRQRTCLRRNLSTQMLTKPQNTFRPRTRSKKTGTLRQEPLNIFPCRSHSMRKLISRL